jgi:hypothetical protein
MMKLEERDGSPFVIGRETMRKLLLLRADRSLFASDADIDRLVRFSGGHPRELLRLLKLCCELADDLIDRTVVQSAIDKLAAGTYQESCPLGVLELRTSMQLTSICTLGSSWSWNVRHLIVVYSGG